MALFRSIKRAFGFSDNGDEPNDELDGINGERGAKRPYVNPFKTDDKPAQESGKSEDAPVAPTSNEVSEQLLSEVIAIVNRNLPPFVVDNLDVEAERKSIGEALKPSVDAFMKQVKDESAADRQTDKTAIAELQEKVKTTEAQRRAVLAKYNDMQNKVANLEAEREQFELENKSLLNKIKVMKVKAGDTDFSDIDEAVASIDSSKKELESLTQEYQTKMEITNALISELRADAATKSDEVKKLNQQLADAQQRNDELAKQVEQLEKQLEEVPDSDLIADVQRKIEQFEQFKIKKNQEITELKQRLAQSESSSGDVSDQINAFKQRNEELEKTIDKLNRQAADASQKRNRRDIEVANQYNDLKTRYNDALKQLEETKAQVEQLNADASVTQDIVDEMSRKNETITLQYRDASAMLTLAQDELDSARRQITELEASRDDLQQQIDALKEAAAAQAAATPIDEVPDSVEPQPVDQTLVPEVEAEPLETIETNDITDILETTELADTESPETIEANEQPVETQAPVELSESVESPALAELPDPVEAQAPAESAEPEPQEVPEPEPPVHTQSAFDGIDDIDWLLPTPPSNKPKIVEEDEPEPVQPKKKTDSRQMSLF